LAIEKPNSMDEFLNPFWNLDQIFGWAETRDPELVRAAAWPRYGRPKPTLQIRIRSTHAATALLRDGRDIDGELWAASGWTPKISTFDPLPMVRAHADKHDVPAYRAYLYKDLRIDEPLDPAASALVTAWKLTSEPDRELLGALVNQHARDRAAILSDGRVSKLPIGLTSALRAFLSQPEVHGPPHVYVREPFPTLNYLEFLFRASRLVATGMLRGDPRSVDISPADWGGLSIGVGGEFERMAVWRQGRFNKSSEGDFENVRVAREELLQEFPEEKPTARVPGPTIPSDDDILKAILEVAAANRGFVGQREGAEIVRARFPEVTRDRARRLIKEAIGNEKRGPRGPRHSKTI
jgi:hypothetical protein